MSVRPLKRTLTETTSVYTPKKTKVTNSTKWNKSAYGQLNSPYKIMLPYGDAWIKTVGSDGIYSCIYRGNSVHDPDFSGIGGIPLGATEMKTLFNRVYVSASSITVNGMTDANTNGRIYIWADNNTTNPANMKEVMERCAKHRGKSVGCNAYIDKPAYMYNTTKKISGGSNKENDYSSDGFSNPREEWYWHVAITNQKESVTNVNVQLTMKYYTEWIKAKTLIN